MKYFQRFYNLEYSGGSIIKNQCHAKENIIFFRCFRNVKNNTTTSKQVIEGNEHTILQFLRWIRLKIDIMTEIR